MKKIILILLVFACLKSSAQSGYTNINQRYNWLAGIFRALGVPSGDDAAFTTGQAVRAGAIFYDSTGADSGLYVYSGLSWRKAGSDLDTTSLSNRINLKLNISDTSAMLTPYVYNGDEGLTKDGKYLKFGGITTSPASLSTNRRIDLNGKTLYFTKGNVPPDSSNFDIRYTPLYVDLLDSLTSDEPGYDVLAKHGASFKRTIRYYPPGYKAPNRGGFKFIFQHEAGDSAVIRTDGQDYNYSLMGEQRFKPLTGHTGRTVWKIGHGTNQNNMINQGSVSVMGNIFIDSTTSGNYVNLNGHAIGLSSYLVMANGAPDTIKAWVGASMSSFITSPSWVTTSYFLAPAVYWNRVGRAWFAYDTARVTKAFQAGKWVIGPGVDTSFYQLKVNGSLGIADTAVYTGNFAAKYTDRSLVDKNYVDSSIAAGGGGTPGIDDVLAEGQTLTTDRTLNVDDKDLTISGDTGAGSTIEVKVKGTNGTTKTTGRTPGEAEASVEVGPSGVTMFARDSINDFTNQILFDPINTYFQNQFGNYQFTNVPDSVAGTNKMLVFNEDDEQIYKAPIPAGGGGGSTDTTSLSNRIDRKFTLNLMTANNTTIGDAETRYFWSQNFGWHASNSAFAMTIAKAATIETINIEMYCGSTVGSNEDWTMTLRNNTTATETAIATVGAASANRTWTNTAMNVDVAAGDKLIIKSVTPTFATNPAGCYVHGYVIFK